MSEKTLHARILEIFIRLRTFKHTGEDRDRAHQDWKNVITDLINFWRAEAERRKSKAVICGINATMLQYELAMISANKAYKCGLYDDPSKFHIYSPTRCCNRVLNDVNKRMMEAWKQPCNHRSGAEIAYLHRVQNILFNYECSDNRIFLYRGKEVYFKDLPKYHWAKLARRVNELPVEPTPEEIKAFFGM